MYCYRQVGGNIDEFGPRRNEQRQTRLRTEIPRQNARRVSGGFSAGILKERVRRPGKKGPVKGFFPSSNIRLRVVVITVDFGRRKEEKGIRNVVDVKSIKGCRSPTCNN
jgi:hypothetical protein